ncbi:MAG: MATE family efflux transporter [Clostridiales bacterium]|nr:MATE family efflux transporter [Clostridiales bacterium]
MQHDLTKGPIASSILRFAFPMILGNLLQQCYNVADTLIVGRFLGTDALAAVGSAYTLMTFLTSIFIGLCMGSGVLFSVCFGRKDMEGLKRSMFLSFTMIGLLTLVLNIAVFRYLDLILVWLHIPSSVLPLFREYIRIIFWGISGTFLYNYAAALLRALGNSSVPLIFLGISAVLNLVLDLWFVLGFSWGIAGAAFATILAQFVSGFGIVGYVLIRHPELRISRQHMGFHKHLLLEIARCSLLTCLQQSVMNLGILMVQGLVNSFGTTVMAAFAAAVKIDSLAYLPVQDFGNAFSTFIAQNHGAGQTERNQKGIRVAVRTSVIFSVAISLVVCIFARPLLQLFVAPEETEILSVGVEYLRIEGAFYWGIGCLFLLYGLFRGMQRPGISLVLTVISLGTRVVLAYVLSAVDWMGVTGIWAAVPIGWVLADIAGFGYYRVLRRKK